MLIGRPRREFRNFFSEICRARTAREILRNKPMGGPELTDRSPESALPTLVPPHGTPLYAPRALTHGARPRGRPLISPTSALMLLANHEYSMDN